MEDKKAQTKMSKMLGISVLLVLCVVMVMGATVFYPISTPTGTTENSSFVAEWNFTEANLKELKWAFNGTNTTIFDNSIIAMFNFDNRSALGESDTLVYDISGNMNNITVVGGATFNSTGGKNNGAFEFDGTSKYFNSLNNLNSEFSSDKITISFWTKIYTSGNFKNLINTGDKSIKIQIDSDNRVVITLSNSTTKTTTYFADYYSPSSEWIFFTLSYNGSQANLYKNKEYIGKITSITGNLNGTSSLQFFREINGSIDDLVIYNKTLSLLEISKIYSSQLTKYNSENWSFQTNESMTTNITGRSYNYYLCSINSTNNENCTTLKTIVRTIENVIISSNFSNLIGNIRNDFYGASTGGRFLANGTIIVGGANNGKYINYTEYRNAWDGSGMNLIRADMNLNNHYSNTSDNSGVNFTGDLTQQIETIKWANSKGYKIIYIIGYTPSFLADNSSGMCLTSTACPPSNMTKFNNIFEDWVERVTENNETLQSNLIFEFWNEPERDSFLLGGLELDDINKATNYTYMYNITYDFSKNRFPTIPFGGCTYSASSGNISNSKMVNYFLDNMSNKMDFFSFHTYRTPQDYTLQYDELISQVGKVTELCNLYNANCSRIIISEWNANSNEIIGNETIQPMQSGSFYIAGLNSLPNNLSLVLYQFGQPSYGNIPAWEMFSGSQLDNNYYPNYNVTKQFATQSAQAGAKVYTSTSSLNDIKTVSTEYDGFYAITVINTDTEAKNITVDTDGTVTKLYNLETGEEFTSLDGTFNVGVIDTYEILYLGYEGTTSGLVCQMNLNENSGSIAYDILGLNNGVIIDGTWVDDGVLVTLINLVDYTISGNVMTILDEDNYYKYVIATYNRQVTTGDGYSTITTLIEGLSGGTSWLAIIITVSFAAIIVAILTKGSGDQKSDYDY